MTTLEARARAIGATAVDPKRAIADAHPHFVAWARQWVPMGGKLVRFHDGPTWLYGKPSEFTAIQASEHIQPKARKK